MICESEHLTTFTFMFYDDAATQILSAPVWWYDLITTIFVGITVVFMVITYVGYWKYDSTAIPLHYKLSLVMNITIGFYVASYLLGQFIGTAQFPAVSTHMFSAGAQITVVVLNNYFTLCIFCLILLSAIILFQKHCNEQDGHSAVNNAVVNNMFGPILKACTIGCFVAPLVIVALNIGIAGAVTHQQSTNSTSLELFNWMLKTSFSRMVEYYGGDANGATHIARFWPAHSTMYFGMVLPIVVIIFFFFLIALKTCLKIRSATIQMIANPDYIIEFRNLIFQLIVYILTFLFGFLSSELYQNKNTASGLFWTFVSLKWSWMAFMIYFGIFQRREIKDYLRQKFYYDEVIQKFKRSSRVGDPNYMRSASSASKNSGSQSSLSR